MQVNKFSMIVLGVQFSIRSVDDARETYERLVSVFPTSGRYWKTYIEQEVSKRFLMMQKIDQRLTHLFSDFRSCIRSSLRECLLYFPFIISFYSLSR